MKIVNAAILLLMLPLAVMAQGGPTQGQGFHEDCAGSCTGTNQSQCWAHIHDDHSENGDQDPSATTSNCGTLPSGEQVCADSASATAEWTWLGGTKKSEASFACTTHTCSVAMTLDCNNGRRSRTGGCAQNNGSPRVTLFRDSVGCISNDPANSMVCSCTSSGELTCAYW